MEKPHKMEIPLLNRIKARAIRRVLVNLICTLNTSGRSDLES
jgi:hypothetical protein